MEDSGGGCVLRKTSFYERGRYGARSWLRDTLGGTSEKESVGLGFEERLGVNKMEGSISIERLS